MANPQTSPLGAQHRRRLIDLDQRGAEAQLSREKGSAAQAIGRARAAARALRRGCYRKETESILSGAGLALTKPPRDQKRSRETRPKNISRIGIILPAVPLCYVTGIHVYVKHVSRHEKNPFSSGQCNPNYAKLTFRSAIFELPEAAQPMRRLFLGGALGPGASADQSRGGTP